jgi:hypothetical protein
MGQTFMLITITSYTRAHIIIIASVFIIYSKMEQILKISKIHVVTITPKKLRYSEIQCDTVRYSAIQCDTEKYYA